ncbi:Exophilin-5 [Manis pentadactyla]|nr:Exophilin-5 [Manis pentadactyla]
MTKAPQGFDFSFLNDEEARKILQVLERNEELQRAEKDRISKLQKTKRDIRWLQGVTGEWFEEIQRKKFCNEMDVSQMLKQPLTFRLRKGMAENDCMESHTSRSKNTPNPRNTTSVPSRLNFRSSFASLFSFRKSRKETSKLRLLGRKGCDGHVGPPVSVRQTITQARIYPPPPEYQPVDSAFVCKPAGMREGGVMLPWDASLLENEFFQVLDDLDSTLAQEQSASSVNTRAPLNHGSTRQFSHFYSSENKHGNITGRHKNHYNDTPNMSFYNILRPGNPREGFKIFSPRTRTIYDMYRTRDPRVLKEDHVQMNTFGSASLCFDSRQQSASPATRYFTARSLHFPTITQNKNGFIPASHQQSPKRTPLSSIIWNRPDSSRERPDREEFLRAPSPMEVDSSDQYTYSRCFQENRGYEFYRSQSIYQTVGLNTPMDNAMSPDPFENLENMPFYHQENPFARSFFSKTFGHSRGQRFGQSPFWGQQEEHSSCPDFHQSRKPFTSSDRDFELISSEANGASPGHGQNVPPQHWGSFSPNYRTNISGEQKQPHPWQFASQTSTLESMEVSQGNGNHTTHFGTPNACSMTGSSYHIRSGGLECQQDSSSTEVHIHKEPYSFGRAQTVASSFKTSFPQVPDNRGNPQSPNFQNPTITLQKSKPPSLPIKSYTEITEVNSNSVDSPPLIENQPNILVTEVNNEKDLNESILEKDKQLDEVDQTNVTGETPQAVSQTVITDPVPGFQNPRSQDLAKCIFDAMEEQCTTTHSANCSKSAASHSIPCDSLDLSAGTLPDSSPLNDSCLDALGIPSAAGFSRKSPAGKDPSLGEREEKDSSKSQSTHFSVGPSENQKRDASCMPVHNREADAIECHLHPPLREGKGKGKDEDNVKCLEVVSVYYTLPRKPSKKFCSLLQKFTQNIDSLTEATKSETETFSHVLEKDKVNYSTQEQSGTLSAGDLKMLVSSAQNSRCLSHATENMTILQLPGIRPSESMLQEIASIEADAPLHKGGPNAGEMSPENVAKTQNRRERGVKLQSETLHASSMLQEKEVTEEKSENYQQPVESGNSGPSTLSSHSDKNVENSQTIRGSGEYAGHGRANTATGNGRCLQNDATGIAIDESSSGLQPGGSGGGKGAGFQKKTERAVSDSESQIFALTPALQKLQLDEKTCLGETDLDSFQSESSELPQRSQVVNTTENSKAEGEMQELAQGQPLYPGRGNKNKTILDDLEKGKSRSSGKHRLAAMSKAGRKYPSKDLSPRRHVATVFPQSGNGSAKCLSFGMPECHPLSPEPTSKSTESTDGSRLNNDGVDVAKSEISNREASIHLSKWKPNSTSQPRKNKLKNISEPPPKYENSKDVTVSPILERKSGDLAQGTFTTIREAAFSDHRKRLNSPFPLETADQSIISIPLATCQQQRSASSPEWEPELHPYRSKSLKGINVHGDLLRKSSPPKVRDRHFSESTSIDSTLSQLTLGNEFSNSGYGRKFRSFSELPSCNANKSSAVYSGRKKAGPLSATSISRPIDYGIFGKDQQLAFLENVKRSLTQGRLWKPSFLKNPGFLKDDIINPPNPAGSSNSNSPRNQMPEDGLFPSAPLNIYEEDPVDSDCNTDTTTDDEYYLDENDKESEL